MKKTYVLSLGGSIMAPDGVDPKFVKAFCHLIAQQTKRGNKFIIVTGGGKVARDYQDALRAIRKPSNEELDWMGIYVTRINASLLRLGLGKLAYSDIVTDPDKKVKFHQPVLVAGGSRPGHNTDYVSTHLAKIYGAETVINLSNTDYLYDRDPNKFKGARKIERISLTECIKLIGSKRKPGGHYPFDPVALVYAKKHKQKIIIANGRDLKNLENILKDKRFKGTLVS